MFDYEIGLDLHKRNSLLCVVDSNGNKLGHYRVDNWAPQHLFRKRMKLFFLDKLASIG
jgi:hypothetical protein